MAELEYYYNKFSDTLITSVFFGGGTPSLMEPKTVGTIIAFIKKYFKTADDIEITLEGNPTSIEASKYKAFADAGINRASIGVQSFNNKFLKFLGREHNGDNAREAIRLAAEHFGNYSIDLIYALKGQSMADWQADLDEALKYSPNHVSLYQLTIEKGTEFYADSLKGRQLTAEEKLAEEMYDLTIQKCSESGLELYEVSNFAKPSFESKHNLNYWRFGNYIGIGAGAHGRVEQSGARYSYENVSKPEAWLTKVQGNGEARLLDLVKLNSKSLVSEYLMFGLRLAEGVELNNLLRFEGTSLDKNKLEHLQAEGLIEFTDKTIKSTDAGRRVVHSIVNYLTS